MRSSYIIISILILGLIFSCDKDHWITYVATNNSNSEITIVYSIEEYTLIDTSIILKPKTKDTLFIREINYGGRVSNPEEGNDSIWAFKKFKAYQKDTLPNITNLKLMSRWTYRSLNSDNAEINIDIVDSDFE